MDAGHNPVGTELRERLGLIPLEQAADSGPLTAADVRLRRPIGQIFVELGFITKGQLEGALAAQKETGARIGEILVEQGILTRLDLASALAEHWESAQPAAAVAGPSPGNGVPATAPLQPRRVVEDDAAILELEPAEGRVEPVRPARRLWRRSRRSSAAEGIAPPTQIGEGEEHPATPGDLEGEIADLGRVLTSLDAVRVNDALATEARLAAVEAAILDMAGQGTWARDTAEQGRTGRPEALTARLELVERKLEALAAFAEELRADVQSRVASLASELGAQQEESAALRVETTSLGARIEEWLAADDGAEWSAAVAELGRRIDERAAIAEEQARASERAIREGLASLGERLTDPGSKLSAAGRGQSPIERLGAAVVEADARLADQIPVSEAEGCVAFAPTAAGYRLVELPGRPPEIGSTLELDVCDGPLVVTRHGRSPLPFDRRPCVYLDRD